MQGSCAENANGMLDTGPTGATSPRPVNVALLYCEKNRRTVRRSQGLSVVGTATVVTLDIGIKPQIAAGIAVL